MNPTVDTAARRERLLSLWRTMTRIRAFEEAAELASQGGVAAWGLEADHQQVARVRGPLHLSTGQEAVAAAVCANLQRRDLLTSTHRGHGHTLAKGADTTRMMCELFGRAEGCNGGKGGSMHIADFGVGMLGANGVVAAGIPIAVGAAQAQKIRKTGAIVACFFGDGAINRGPFLEGLNWARALGIDSVAIDGNDVEAVDTAAARLVAEVRRGAPALLHAITYRLTGHVSVDPGAYRDPAEVAQARRDEPLVRARSQLQALGAAAAADRIEREAREEIARAVQAADAAAPPAASAAYLDVLDSGGGRWF